MPAGDCVVTGSIGFMDTTNLHPWIDALTKVGEDGRLIAAVMNSTDEEITIQPGTCYSTISLTPNGQKNCGVSVIYKLRLPLTLYLKLRRE
jgi:hypothetical protein